jgi:hypothetical protein
MRSNGVDRVRIGAAESERDDRRSGRRAHALGGGDCCVVPTQGGTLHTVGKE